VNDETGTAYANCGLSCRMVANMIEANRDKPGLRYLDRFNKPLPW
jgi:hypothetical protein